MRGDDVGRLFAKYLTMVYAHTKLDFHPASRHVFRVIEASAGAISVRGGHWLSAFVGNPFVPAARCGREKLPDLDSNQEPSG